MSIVVRVDGSFAQQNNQEGPLQSRALSSEDFIAQLQLKNYQAVLDGLSLCQGDSRCLKEAGIIQSLSCFDAACDGKDQGKKPLDCHGVSNKIPKDQQTQANDTICAFIKYPNAASRQALSKFFPNAKEVFFVMEAAYNLALIKSARDCESYIMDYVGLFGSQWNSVWYRAMAGCRILGRETTVDQEEKDFGIWLDVLQRGGSCSDISIREMRNACSSPHAASPVLTPAGGATQAL